MEELTFTISSNANLPFRILQNVIDTLLSHQYLSVYTLDQYKSLIQT